MSRWNDSPVTLGPVKVSAHVWYYEEASGLRVFVESIDKRATLEACIPWENVRRSIARKDKRRITEAGR